VVLEALATVVLEASAFEQATATLLLAAGAPVAAVPLSVVGGVSLPPPQPARTTAAKIAG
jgi:hypothetical protein